MNDSNVVRVSAAPGGINARVTPLGSLEVLSQQEVNRLLDTSEGGLHEIFRRCCLAVLNCGAHTDDATAVLEEFRNFDVRVIQQERGIKLELTGAPASAFVDGQMIKGIQEHLFSVLRDVLHSSFDVKQADSVDPERPDAITNAVFHILRNAGIMRTRSQANLVVCWGGHSIGREEYEYTKSVGYEVGLRGLHVCTGCGPGAMKGPMKGATIAHAKQRIRTGRYIGITEPGIIAAESPNPIVNSLVIMPDIEKRLEAFVRTGHGIVVFPGGAGTAEEILYLLGILLHPDNREMPYPLIFTGPAGSADYFKMLDKFIGATLGPDAQGRYTVIVGDPAEVARQIRDGMDEVRAFRRQGKDAYYYNWLLKIDPAFQRPFLPTHENMAALDLTRDQPVHRLAAQLRRAFSGIVAGNVKDAGIRAIQKHGPFDIRGSDDIMGPLDTLLRAFVAQNRMKLAGGDYRPCYRLTS